MASFLFKTEPGEYSFQRLQADGRTTWSGVSSPAALAHLRSVRTGDRVLIYHTGAEKAIVGSAEVVSDPREDPENPGRNDAGAPRVPVVDIKAVRAATTPITLAHLKADPRFEDFALVKQPRLSVMPVPARLDKILRGLAGL